MIRRLGLWAALAWRLRGEAAMVWGLLRSANTPLLAKGLAIAAFAYLLMPADLLTDFIPILGWIDDVAVVSGLLWLAYRVVPQEVYEALRAQAGRKAKAS